MLTRGFMNMQKLLSNGAAQRSFSSRMPTSLSHINTKVLDDARLKKLVDPDVYIAFEQSRTTGKPMEKSARTKLAENICVWAQDQGADSYSHWFSPVRGMIHGEKIETFLDVDFKTMNLGSGLSGTELFQTETDGSSFPNGGLRVTHEAAAFMGWDTASPPFIYDNVLYIPSAFVSWTGEALDQKTPLLRSNAAVSREAVRLLRHLGFTDVQSVVANVGWEQEFFVIDSELAVQRPDLVACGRTLLGQTPLKGQQASDHYFAKMPPRVREFMQKSRERMWELGISIDCLHAEVAPGQFELSPVFSLTNLAADTNVLAREVLQDTASAMGLTVLFHEKPFAGINGSGKHNNWGLNTETGANLYVPGKTAAEERRFIAMVAALMRAIRVHGDLFRVGVSTAGNDHRLGAQEAPPPIITLYLGKSLHDHVVAAGAGAPFDGYQVDDKFIPVATSAPDIKANYEDRNRTAPFPYCTNRFEFRAVGSNQHIAFPLALVNAAVAEGMQYISELVEGGMDADEAVRQTIRENQGCLFTGDGYNAPALQQFAKDNDLFNIATSPDAYNALTSPKNVKLFVDLGVFSANEVMARQAMLYDEFATELATELRTLLTMLRTQMLPAALEDLRRDTETALGDHPLVQEKQDLVRRLADATHALNQAAAKVPEGDSVAAGRYLDQQIRPLMADARAAADALESIMAGYPFPTYSELVGSAAGGEKF